MKKFYGRDVELSRLREMMRQSFEDYSRFTVIGCLSMDDMEKQFS